VINVPQSKPKHVRAAAMAQSAAIKVLVAVDGSDYTNRMLDFLVRNIGIIPKQPEFTVLHAVPKASAHALSVLDRLVLKHYYQDEATRVFRPVRSRFRKIGVEAEFIYRIGNPAEVISSTAESGGFHILVMGTQGTNALSRLVMGSVVSRVMAECKVPVLLVP
jgi:nucleotide-binding universal stress UspA family protein